MPAAEVITIGTELLLGEITDTNARYLARRLRDLGIDLYRKVTVGDNISRIAQAVQESLKRAEIILTTGGLGPTIDDPTRLGIAQALEVEVEFHPELWEQIKERFMRFGRLPTENNKRQAFLPKGASPCRVYLGRWSICLSTVCRITCGGNTICTRSSKPASCIQSGSVSLK